MAKVIGIFGESGCGKTTSLRGLDPKTTVIFDADKKGLSWKDWRKQYNLEAKNYVKTDVPGTILNALWKINGGKHPEDPNKECDPINGIKTIVIDTMNGIMVSTEMRNIKVQGYGKWSDLAAFIWGIMDYALQMRDDLTVILIFHSITESNEDGMNWTHIRTNGRKLEKLVPESKLTTALWAVHQDGKYSFITSSENSTAKTPMGAFDTVEIPNDITLVLKALEDY